MRTLALLVVIAALSGTADAKRVAPKPVTPVVADGVRYSAGGDGRDAYVIASNIATGKELWRKKIFHNRINLWMEEDNQWLFIIDLSIAGDELRIRDEASRCYVLNVKSRKLRKVSCP